MIIKITPDKEKAKSILRLTKNRENFVSKANPEEFSTIITENYYEIIKELATALTLIDGLKTAGEGAHKELISHLSSYKEFDEYEIHLMNDLRIKRNLSSYEGEQIDKGYLENKKEKIISIINKLKNIVGNKLK